MKSTKGLQDTIKCIIMLHIAILLPLCAMTQAFAFGSPTLMTAALFITQSQSGDNPEPRLIPSPKKLTLEDAINRALEANRGLADAVDNVEGARLSLVAAESEFELKIFPSGRAGITGTSDEGPDEILGAGITLEKKLAIGTQFSISPNIQKTGDTYQTAIDTGLVQPLLRGVSREYNLSGVHSAEFGARSTRRTLYLRRVNTVLLTIGGVYEVIRQRELFRLNEESAVRLRVHAEAARAKKKIGLATRSTFTGQAFSKNRQRTT